MRTVVYKYDIKENIVTPFGESGIITMLGYDKDGVQYYVKSATNNNWFDEDELKKNDT